jgi:hypothetical protein
VNCTSCHASARITNPVKRKLTAAAAKIEAGATRGDGGGRGEPAYETSVPRVAIELQHNRSPAVPLARSGAGLVGFAASAIPKTGGRCYG